jgi:alcohol dehydrogenase
MQMTHQPASPDRESLPPFDHQPRTRIVFGVDSVERVGALAREMGAKKILLVTDRGLVDAGHTEHVRRNLETAGIKVTTFDKARENPTTKCVDDCVAVAKAAGPDTIIGLGGGSAMDTAKGCNFLLTNGGRMQDYHGVGKASKPMLPLIAIPTTAGTGSECQSAALIVDERTHQKMACLDPKAAARIAILDPRLTLSQPARVTACAGMDAIAHALETAVTTKRNALSIMYSREAFRLCVKAFAEVLTHPKDLEARGRMLLGAALGGMAIENSMLGGAHAAANPVTAHFGLAHGQAVGLMLPHVIRFNAHQPESRKIYIELGVVADLTSDGHDTASRMLVERIETLLDLAQIPRQLRDSNGERKMIPRLAEEAALQWTAKFNPRPLSKQDFVQLYEAAFGGPVRRVASVRKRD